MRSNLVLCASTKPTNKNARKRKRKHLRKKKSSSGDPSSSSSSSSSRVAKSPGRSLSEDELHRHLNAKVNFGKHGPVGPRVRNRGLKPGTGECGTDGGNEGDVSIESNDNGNSRQRDQQFFLRQLNNRPTLVLNANYVVSRNRVRRHLASSKSHWSVTKFRSRRSIGSVCVFGSQR